MAKSLREEVHQDSNNTQKTEALLQKVESNWKKTLESIADLVEYEAERRANQQTEALQKELSELREFKNKAQDSNIAGTLRKHLMSFKS